MLLVATLLALVVGPVVYRLVQSRPAILAVLDGLTLTAIGGLVLLHGIPEAVEHAGLLAIAVAVLGMMGPTLLERWLVRTARRTHELALVLALIGLPVHAMLDGTAIAASDLLGLAVVLHTIPFGLTVWMLLTPQHSLLIRIAVVLSMAVGTVAGFVMGDSLIQHSTFGLGLFEGLVAGSLLHVLVHRGGSHAHHHGDGQHHHEHAPIKPWHSGIGALLGVGLLLAVDALASHHGEHGVAALAGTGTAFVRLAAESAPALLLGYLGAGLLEVYLPRAGVAWMSRGNTLSQALRGMGFGLPLPLCSCGVVPLYRSLIVRGAPIAAAAAFLVATPELGIDALLLSIPLLGYPLALTRLLCAALVALLVGWVVGRLRPSSAMPQPASSVATNERARPPLRAALRAASGEIVDVTAPWILLGLGLAVVGARLLDPRWFARLPWGADVVLLALAGIPTYVCASGATPLAAMFIARGVSPGAAVAFLLTGPATNATTFGLLSRLHGVRVASAFGGLVATSSIALGLLVNTVLPPSRHHALDVAGSDAALSPTKLAAFFLLLMLFAWSMLRQGPRRFVGHVTSLDTGDDDDHH